ncbi:aromatic amino acid aminotransferase [Diplodia corticola]|uniref:Aromatic amino acid aminotransferase n=1 Tax=Diplodia corticola TaxID=236234 RepID=A0A1J9QWU5_9PEZI|nr:aromatic amino acid aminotransferase [Diplodia corticola]OJD33470.1 aromatic amino acid aminotransferase [Diplodia corticola]
MEPNKELPKPVDLSHHLSRNAKNREPSSMKSFYKYFMIPGIGQLAGGLPNERYFPYDDFEARVALPDRFKPTPNSPVDPPTAEVSNLSLCDSPQSARILVPHSSPTTDPLRKIDLDSALQYGTAQGYPPLYQFVRQFTTQNLHPNVPYRGGPEVILTCGSTDGFSKVVQALTNEWSEDRDPIDDREAVLVEEYCYTNAIQAVRPRGVNVVPVKIDDEGMLAKGPGGLEDVLDSWDVSRGRRPHLIYTVTIGQNPTSGVLSLQRRKEIYELCVKYDIIIVEDDPYWYLQYPSANPAPPSKPEGKSSGFDFLDSLVPSYLSIDYEGRVIRVDTFSKTVAPGCRLGWLTAQPAIVERILRLTETSTQQPSGFVQSMIAELIMGPQSKQDGGGADGRGGWDVSGWVRWLEGLRGNYERRMNAMCDVLDAGKHLLKTGRRHSLSTLVHPSSSNGTAEDLDEDEWAVVESTQIYSFVRPLGGMFVWLRFDFRSHPLSSSRKTSSSSSSSSSSSTSSPTTIPPARLSRALWVFLTTAPHRVLVSPGAIFAPTPDIAARDAHNCFRMCFAACPDADVVPITRRFVRGARLFWRIRDPARIDEILEDEDSGVEREGLEMGGLAGFGFC